MPSPLTTLMLLLRWVLGAWSRPDAPRLSASPDDRPGGLPLRLQRRNAAGARARSSDHARPLQRRALRLVVAQLRQHLLRVLAQARRRAAHRARRRAELHRKSEYLDDAMTGMRDR